LVNTEQETCDGEFSVEKDDDFVADSEDDQGVAYNDKRSGGEYLDKDGHRCYESED
jgi:hypothetical protein